MKRSEQRLEQVEQVDQAGQGAGGAGGEIARVLVADPDGGDPGGVAGEYVKLGIADHPGLLRGDTQMLAGEEERSGVGFVRQVVIARDEKIDVEVVSGADGGGADATVASDDCAGDIVEMQPVKQLTATVIKAGVAGSGLLVALEDGQGGLPLHRRERSQCFEDRLIANAHFAFDGGEIQHGLGERAVHVKENSAGQGEHDDDG